MPCPSSTSTSRRPGLRITRKPMQASSARLCAPIACRSDSSACGAHRRLLWYSDDLQRVVATNGQGSDQTSPLLRKRRANAAQPLAPGFSPTAVWSNGQRSAAQLVGRFASRLIRQAVRMAAAGTCLSTSSPSCTRGSTSQTRSRPSTSAICSSASRGNPSRPVAWFPRFP